MISTGDKDLAQLVRPGITLVNTMSNETLDEAGVLAKFGVRADQVLDLLTLTGDAVDNVPGVPKVGPKTAAKWLAQYGTLDAVIAHAGEIPGVVGENLRATLDWLPQGKRLLTVKTDCALPVAPTDLRLGAPDADALRPLYERFEFKSWLRDDKSRGTRGECRRKPPQRTPRQDTRTFAEPGARDAPPRRIRRRPCPRHYETVLDDATLERWLRADRDAPSSCASIPRRRPRSDAGEDRRPVVRRRAGHRVLHPARASLSGRRRPAAVRLPRSRASRRGSPMLRARSSARTSSTTSTCSRTTASRSPASRTTRCCSPTCSRRTGRTTWTTSRGGT